MPSSCWSAGASTLGGSFHNGRRTLSKPWPDEVIQPYRQVWEHILGNHRPGTSVPSKTAFPPRGVRNASGMRSWRPWRHPTLSRA